MKPKTQRVGSVLLLCMGLNLLSSCATQPRSERESAAVRQRFDNQGEINTSQLALAIRQWNPTARVDLFQSLFMATHARSVRRFFEELTSIAIRENDLILLGDLEFCKSDINQYAAFKMRLAREDGEKSPLSVGFAKGLGAEVVAAREEALHYYLSAGDYLGASFVESEMSYHTEIGMNAQAEAHVRLALEYLAKSKNNSKRAMPGAWWFHLLRGSYESELRGRLEELETVKISK